MIKLSLFGIPIVVEGWGVIKTVGHLGVKTATIWHLYFLYLCINRTVHER